MVGFKYAVRSPANSHASHAGGYLISNLCYTTFHMTHTCTVDFIETLKIIKTAVL